MRILIYSHDTYGLGHLRRSLTIAGAISGSPTLASVLIATGSPRAHSYDLPTRCDTIKLPAVLKQQDGSYRSRDLDMPLGEILAMRAQLVVSAFRDFRPDVVLVDHAPLGVAGELVPLLDTMRRDRRGAALILGMRDIVDEAEPLERTWRRDGIMTAVENDYDRILVYGSANMRTTAQELGFERLVDHEGNKKLRHVGYLAKRPKTTTPSGRLVVTAGGGGDGQVLMRAFMGFLERGGRFKGGIDLVTGPFLSERRREELRERSATLDLDLQLIEFDPALERRVANAAAVIGMAGYNTVTEIMAAGCPALLVPREEPRAEQWIRIQRLAPLTGFACCRGSKLDDNVFADFIGRVERGEIATRPEVDLDGIDATVTELAAYDPSRDRRSGDRRFQTTSTVTEGR